jgi:hypothetical protein
MSLDSGISSTVVTALQWAIAEAPCDYFAIDFWNHGSGMLNPVRRYEQRGVCFDDSTGNYLNDRDLINVLQNAVKLRGNKKVNILCFDSCLMACMECFASWADYVEYFVASEQTIPNLGWGYDKVLALLSRWSLIPKMFSIGMVEAYRQTYINTSVSRSYTMSAIDANYVKALALSVDSIAYMMTDLLSKEPVQFKNVISKSRNSAISFDEPTYIDLKHFYSDVVSYCSTVKVNRTNQAALNNLVVALNQTIKLMSLCVINNACGSNYGKSCSLGGISIYFPTNAIHSSYLLLDWSVRYPNWLKFLKKYLGK